MPNSDSNAETVDLYQLTEGLGPDEVIDAPGTINAALPPDCLLAELGIELVRVGRGRAEARMAIGRIHLNQRGLAQAGAIVALADATAGWASYTATERGRFTTLDLTINLLRAGRDGDRLVATAAPVRVGRRVEVFEVTVAAEVDTPAERARTVARFTCTQLVLESAPTGGGA